MYTILASARTFSRIVRAKVLIVVRRAALSDTESIVTSWRTDVAYVFLALRPAG